MLLFNDTETTGFPRNGMHARDPSQARVCQIALVMTDNKGNIKNQFSSFIKPDGWQVSVNATQATGITTEMCADLGIDAATALEVFLDMSEVADHYIAHNMKFDKQMMGIECQAHAHEMPEFKETSCTMLDSKRVFGFGKLEQVYEEITGEVLVNAHDALADTMACKEVYFGLKKKENE